MKAGELFVDKEIKKAATEYCNDVFSQNECSLEYRKDIHDAFIVGAAIVEISKQKPIIEKIKTQYQDYLRTYNAKYQTLLSQKTFGDNFRVTQGSLSVMEFLIQRFEDDFPEICHCDYDWHKNWKDENFKK